MQHQKTLTTLLVVAVLVLSAVPSWSAPAITTITNIETAGNRILFDAEIVTIIREKSNGAQLGPVNVQTVTMAGYNDVKAGSKKDPYPFWIERLFNSNLTHIVYFDALQRAITTDLNDMCVVEHLEGTTEEQSLWLMFTTVFNTPLLPSEGLFVFRGIDVESYNGMKVNLNFPISYGGEGTPRDYDLEWHMTSSTFSYLVDFANVHNMPVTLTLTSDGGATALYTHTITFTFFSNGAFNGTTEFRIPDGCVQTPQPTSKKPEAEGNEEELGPHPMPTFPEEFSANFQVIFPRQNRYWQMRESYSATKRFSYTSLQAVVPDEVGRVFLHEWYVDGTTHLSYYREREYVPYAANVIPAPIQQYFWPDEDRCSRSLMAYDIVAESAASLLMLRPTSRPMFIGNQTVRSVPCGVWTAIVDGARVTWYWATKSETAFADSPRTGGDGESAATSRTVTGSLMRMVVESTSTGGLLFPHHPFFAQSYQFPLGERSITCILFLRLGIRINCNNLNPKKRSVFIYDITSFVAHVPQTDFSVPEVCSTTQTTRAFPSMGCYTQGILTGGAIAGLLIVVAALFAILGVSCMWCRYAPMVRRLQQELFIVVRELRSLQEEQESRGVANAGRRNSINESTPSGK